MSKLMTLELLSSISGAVPSDAVDELFTIMNRAVLESNEKTEQKVEDIAVHPDNLRDDTIIECSETEKELIKSNFPKEKNGYLVVSKVIEEI